MNWLHFEDCEVKVKGVEVSTIYLFIYLLTTSLICCLVAVEGNVDIKSLQAN